MERVSIRQGDSPFLIVAPHGETDINTGPLVARIAEITQAYSVINWGWKRSERYDYWKGMANCNDIRHCHEDVVKEEFLDPILNFTNRIINDFGFCYAFYIHGVSNAVRKEANDPHLDVIIGYGNGRPAIHSCDLRTKNFFLSQLEKNAICPYEGAPGGKYAGRGFNNLNQLFRGWYRNEFVESMQLEVVSELRINEEIMKFSAEAIGLAIDGLLDLDDTTEFSYSTPKRI